MFEEIIKRYNEAWLYTKTFKSFEGNIIEMKSVVLVSVGVNFHHVFNTWQTAAGHAFSTPERISIEEALKLPSLPDRLSLKGRIEMIGDVSQYITHEYEMKYL